LENEKQLVKDAVHDHQAFGVLYDFYFDKIYGYVFKRCGKREIAEDIVSETFTKVFCGLKNFNPRKGSFKSWVYKIATNNLIDYYRKELKNTKVDIEDITEPAEIKQTTEEYLMSLEDKKKVMQIIQKMSGRYQQVVNLKYFAELSNQEIAETMHISANNVGVLLYRALNKFKSLHK